MNLSRIVHVVCPNGLGHFKRATDIWAEIHGEVDAEVRIVCEPWQLDKTTTWSTVQMLSQSPNVSFTPRSMNGALRWNDNPASYSLDDYMNFRDEASGWKEFTDADYVISDNLVAILDLHPNISLLGSFLWSDVLKESFGDRAPQEIIQFEENLLNRKGAEMISVEEVTMPAVSDQTNNIGLPWFCHTKYHRPLARPSDKNQFKVLCTAGLSGASADGMKMLMQLLSDQQDVEIYATDAVISKFSDQDLPMKRFDFAESSFMEMDIMIARPGVGSLTEAIQYQIPLIAVDDNINSEMKYNATRVEGMGIGLNLTGPMNFSWEAFKNQWGTFVESFKHRPVNGFQEIKKVINSHL